LFKHILAVAVGAIAISLASCGGGGSAPGSPATSAPVSTPTPTPVPTSESTTAALSTTGTTSVSLGGVSGAQAITNASVTLPVANVASNVSVRLMSAVPSAVPTPSATVRRNSLGATVTSFAYVSITFSNTVTLAASPAFSVVFPAALPSGNYYSAVYDPTGTIAVGWQVLAGPTTGGSDTLAFTAATYTPPVTFSGGVTYTFTIVSSASPLATPTPIQASPTSLSFNAVGAAAQAITLSEAGYTGTFTANASLCTNIASVATTNSGDEFMISPVNAGICTMYFIDANGDALGVPITVTVTQIVGQ
jgi:hypothetical protein